MKAGMPVGKIARRLQVAPTVKTLKVLERRPTPPGMHGGKKFGSKSVYATQLIEKQKLRFQFMISEKVLRRAFKLAKSKKGSTGDNILQMLDSRLDATVFRSGVVRSMLAARQLVSHGNVLVNGKRVDKPGFQVSTTDIVSFSKKAMNFAFLVEGIRDGIPVAYIELNKEAGTIRRSVVPPRKDIPVMCSEQTVVEWYSR